MQASLPLWWHIPGGSQPLLLAAGLEGHSSICTPTSLPAPAPTACSYCCLCCHVCRGLREELEAEGVQRPRPLVAVRPTDSLASVVRTLFDRGCSMAPVLCAESKGAHGRGG